jgi:hypothetical protein
LFFRHSVADLPFLRRTGGTLAAIAVIVQGALFARA